MYCMFAIKKIKTKTRTSINLSCCFTRVVTTQKTFFTIGFTGIIINEPKEELYKLSNMRF
jgi:hypothetical protein